MIKGVIYDRNVFETSREEIEHERASYYDSIHKTLFTLLTANTRNDINYYLKITDDTGYNKRGFSTYQLSRIVSSRLNISYNTNIDISGFIAKYHELYYDVFSHHDSGNKGIVDIMENLHDTLDYMQVLKSLVIEKYPFSGVDEVIGIFVITTNSNARVQVPVGLKIERVHELYVLFDGEYTYTPLFGMKPMQPDGFFKELESMHQTIRLSDKSELPNRFTDALSDYWWTYLTGITMPGTFDEVQDIINKVTNGSEILAQNPEFQRYICNRYLRR